MQKLLFGFRLLILSTLTTTIACYNPKNIETDENSPIIKFTSPMSPCSWTNENTLQSEIYHSPPYSSRIDSSFEYSCTFNAKMGDIGYPEALYVNVNLFCYFPEKIHDLLIVFAIDSANVNKHWISKSIMDSISSPNTWQQVNLSYVFPQNLSPEYKLSIYAWSPERQLCYIDDFEISIF